MLQRAPADRTVPLLTELGCMQEAHVQSLLGCPQRTLQMPAGPLPEQPCSTRQLKKGSSRCSRHHCLSRDTPNGSGAKYLDILCRLLRSDLAATLWSSIAVYSSSCRWSLSYARCQRWIRSVSCGEQVFGCWRIPRGSGTERTATVLVACCYVVRMHKCWTGPRHCWQLHFRDMCLAQMMCRFHEP